MGIVPGGEMRWMKRNRGALRRAETVFADVRIICGERGLDFSFVNYGDYILGSGLYTRFRSMDKW